MKDTENLVRGPVRAARFGESALRSSALLLVVCQLSIASVANAQLANSAWPDYGGGYLNQHRSPYLGPSSVPQLRWQFDMSTLSISGFQRGYHQPILLPDRTIVFNTADSANDQIFAIRENGTLLWDIDDVNLGPWLAADQASRIYTLRQAGSARLRSVSFAGSSQWDTVMTGSNPIQNGPAVGRNGSIYAAVDFSPLSAFNTAGTQSWSSANSGYYVNPAIALDGTIIVGGTNLTALSPAGAMLWQKPVLTTSGKFPAYLSPAIGDDGTIYAGQINYSNLIALTPAGVQKWARTDLDGAPAIGTNGDVYVVPESGILHALNPLDGTTRWTYATGKTDYYNSEGVTIDGNGNLYISNDQGVLTSLTPNGQFRWQWDFAPNQSGFIGISAPVIGSNGYLYIVGGDTGKVFSLALVPEPGSVAMLLLAVTFSYPSLPRHGGSRSSCLRTA